MCVTPAENKNDRWHLFEVENDENEITNISKQIIEGWYAHFWHGADVIAVFTNKTFRFNYSGKETWKETVEYGKKLSIPDEQLDFPIFGL
jgi:hypothetical protein